jgi:hypothetical protein
VRLAPAFTRSRTSLNHFFRIDFLGKSSAWMSDGRATLNSRAASARLLPVTPKKIKAHCRLDEECQELLEMAMTELYLFQYVTALFSGAVAFT